MLEHLIFFTGEIGIKIPSPISDKEDNETDSFVTTEAEKDLIIWCHDDVECLLKKSYIKDEGISVRIDSDFEMIQDDTKNCMNLTRNGQTVAHIFESNDVPDTIPIPNSPVGGGGSSSSSSKPKRKKKKKSHMNPNADLDEATLKHMKAPVALLLENMSMDDMHLTLSVIVAANNRLIRTAMMSVYGPPPTATPP